MPDTDIPDHYWVDCEYCGKQTVAFERECRHCGAMRGVGFDA